MADSFLIDNLNGCEKLEIFGDDSSKIKTLGLIINGIPTDIVFCDYSDKQLLILTQFQKVGTFILVTKGSARNLNGVEDVYDVKTLSGLDSQEYHLAARYLVEQLNIFKPVLFSISLKDHSLKTLQIIAKALKENNVF